MPRLSVRGDVSGRGCWGQPKAEEGSLITVLPPTSLETKSTVHALSELPPQVVAADLLPIGLM